VGILRPAGLVLAVGAVPLLAAPGMDRGDPAPAFRALTEPVARAPADGLPWLAVTDGLITDEAGRRVLLRGFNTHDIVGLVTPAHRAAG
jgi:hypothetical protein